MPYAMHSPTQTAVVLDGDNVVNVLSALLSFDSHFRPINSLIAVSITELGVDFDSVTAVRVLSEVWTL